MIIIRLWGGLGNQMFQYAYGYSVAKRYGADLILDTTFYTDKFLKENSRFTKQILKITEYPLDYSNTINVSEQIAIFKLLQRKTVNRIIRIPKHFSFSCGNGYRYIKETRFEYSDHLIAVSGDKLYLDGYWQSSKYFEQYKDEIGKQFNIVQNSIIEEANQIGITQENSVAIHIRMGDYTSSKHKSMNGLYLLPMQYYKNAMNEIKYNIPNSHFFVFTNNVEKARAAFEGIPGITFVNEERKLSDFQEMHLMSMCKHQIIANSTYSWWAAWLNKNKQKIIYSPDIVFANRDIVPDNWIKISID